MLIKIKGRNRERFGEVLEGVLNLATVAFSRGYLPTERDIANPQQTGLYWYRKFKDDKFELLPRLNDHKAFIRDSGENFIVLEFYSRYDGDKKQVDALSNLILALFREDEVFECAI